MSSGNWMNKDGLYLKFGTSKATPSKAGEFLYPSDGGTRVIEVRLDLTTLAATDGSTIVEDNLFVPASMIIEQVEVVADTAATGSGAVLNFGLIALDRTTEIDFNGLIAALPLASVDGLGEKTTLNFGSTYAGAMIGTTIGASPGYLCADYDTAAFTAGVVTIRIKYRNVATITQ